MVSSSGIKPDVKWITFLAFLLSAVLGGALILTPKPITDGKGSVFEENDGPQVAQSKYTVTIEGGFPEVPEKAPILKVERIAINESLARLIAWDVFDFEKNDEVEAARDELVVRNGNRELCFHGLHDIFYSESRNSFTVTEWSEEDMVTIAEKLLEKLEKYWSTPTVVERALSKVGPSSVSISSTDIVVAIHEIGVFYQQSVQGFSLIGPGADFSIRIADGRVICTDLHRPITQIEGYMNITVSPLEAVERALSGESAQTELGFQLLCIRPSTGNLTITNIELVYYTDFHGTHTHLPLVYLLKGEIVGPDLGGDIIESEFEEYIFATDMRPIGS